MKEIITDYDELSDICEVIDIKKQNALMREIILALKEVIREKNLPGLSAPQLGYKYRMFCINYKGDIRTYINPVITEASGLTLSREQCPSIPDKTFLRVRNNQIKVTFQDPLSKIMSQKLHGMAACVFQELLDHLNGLLLDDIGLEIDRDFDEATEEEREEVINAYLDSLDIRQKQAEKAVEEDPAAREISDAINFMDEVVEGKTTLGAPISVEKDLSKDTEDK